jgi:hypothetical protein
MRRLLALLVVLLGLLVAADRLGVVYAQSRVASAVRQTEHLEADPTVQIHGFPFLTQLIGERFHDVEVIVKNYRRGNAIRVSRIDVHLRDVRVAHSALTGKLDRVPVRRVDATALFSYADLTGAHQGLQFGYAGAGRVRVAGSVSAGGVRVAATAVGHVLLEANDFAVSVDSVSVAGVPDAALRAAAQAAVARAFAVVTTLPAFPFHFRLTSVRATGAGIEVAGSADNVVLTRSGG